MDVNSAGAVRASCLLVRCRNPHYFIRRITASSGSNCIYATPHPTYGPTWARKLSQEQRQLLFFPETQAKCINTLGVPMALSIAFIDPDKTILDVHEMQSNAHNLHCAVVLYPNDLMMKHDETVVQASRVEGNCSVIVSENFTLAESLR